MKLCLVCNFQFGDEQELCPKDSSKLVPLGKDPLLGKLIQERYRIDSIIAKGSMGVVYKATQELIGREVAVKILHGYLVADEESLKRFHKEAKAASRLNHPNITTLYDFGVLETGQPYIVMDLLRGTTLAEVLKEREYLPFDEAMVIFRQVCDALSEAHKRGVVHRDMKPENIVLEATERGVSVKVVDFGIAKLVQESEDTLGKITKTGTVCGSPTYMSPEQCDDNQVDARSDVYSLGVVLFETLTGKVPFDGQDIYDVMTMHVKEPAPRLREKRPDISFPPHLEQTIDRALSKDPEARYQTIDEFWDALQGFGNSPRPSMPAQPAEKMPELIASISTGGRTISEAEVQQVIARALEKRKGGSGEQSMPDMDSPMPEPQSDEPLVDPEFVRKKIHAATLKMNARQEPASRQVSSIRNVSTGIRLSAIIHQVTPILVTVVLIGCLLWVVANEARIHTVIDKNIKPMFHVAEPPKPAEPSVDSLIAQNKLDQARAILEKRKKSGKLSENDEENLNIVYMKLARREGKAKHYKAAVALLEQITGPDGQDDEVKSMLKKYKRAAGIR